MKNSIFFRIIFFSMLLNSLVSSSFAQITPIKSYAPLAINDTIVMTFIQQRTGNVFTNDNDLDAIGNQNNVIQPLILNWAKTDTLGNGIADVNLNIERESPGRTNYVSGINQNGSFIKQAGILTINRTGFFRIKSNMGFSGKIIVEYQIMDNNGNTDYAKLVIYISPKTYDNDDLIKTKYYKLGMEGKQQHLNDKFYSSLNYNFSNFTDSNDLQIDSSGNLPSGGKFLNNTYFPKPGFIGKEVIYAKFATKHTIAELTFETVAAPPVAHDENPNFIKGNPFLVQVTDENSNLTPNSIKLVDSDFGSNGLIKTILNEGIWKVDTTKGIIEFKGINNFSGIPSIVYYTGEDYKGNLSNQGKIMPKSGPIANNDDFFHNIFNSNTSNLSILSNDLGGLIPNSIKLLNADANTGDTIKTVFGIGKFIISNGVINFFKLNNYGGNSPIDYKLFYFGYDSDGNKSNIATINFYFGSLRNEIYGGGKKYQIGPNLLENETANSQDYTIFDPTNENDTPTIVKNEGVWSFSYEELPSGNLPAVFCTFTPFPNFIGSVPSPIYIERVQSGLKTTFNYQKITFSAPLSVNLLSLNGQPNALSNSLEWKVNDEKDFGYYEVLKSKDMAEFVSISKVFGGNTNYQHFDNTDIFGTRYYKLKMVDKDGSFTYSKVISILNKEFNSENISLSVFPNPSNGKVFTINTLEYIDDIKVITSTGVFIPFTTTEANGITSINLEGTLSSGSYIINIKTAKGIVSRKVVMN